MQGPDGKPLLVLAREGEGRVALLLSDHIWLWARGYEGGGPHLDLLRRLSHWLMKQPDLEEEALRIAARGRDLTVERQTMADTVDRVTLTTPSGDDPHADPAQAEPGLWQRDGRAERTRACGARPTASSPRSPMSGPANPREFAEVTSTTEVLRRSRSATGGDARRVDERHDVNVPRIVAGAVERAFSGDDWIGLKMRDASVVRGIGVLPVFAGLLGLLLLIGSLAATWAERALAARGREGRNPASTAIGQDHSAHAFEGAVGSSSATRSRAGSTGPGIVTCPARSA